MKLIKITLGFVLMTSLLVACGEDKKDEGEESKEKDTDQEELVEDDQVEESCTYTFSPEETVVKFTGYKHKNKTAVPGTFRVKSFEGEMTADAPHELIMGITGTVETGLGSVFTNDTTRDRKLSQFFFGVMANGEKLTAKVVDMDAQYDSNGNSGGACSVEITMNGVTFQTPAIYKILDTEVTVEANLKFDNWKLDKAHASIAEACEAKHTLEADGEAVTHKEARLEITTTLIKTCK